jgi:hypothetical protein
MNISQKQTRKDGRELRNKKLAKDYLFKKEMIPRPHKSLNLTTKVKVALKNKILIMNKKS